MLLFWGGQRQNPIPPLFAAGEQGAWYDPSDFSTQYQDSNGVTPLTAVAQTVGLMLDKKTGLVSTALTVPTTAWTLAGTITQNNGVLTYTAAVAGDRALRNATFTLGTVASATVTVTGTGNVNVFVGSGSASVTSNTLAGGTQVITFSRYASANFLIVDAGSAGFTGTVTINAVSEVRGNHVVQATGTSRPVESLIVAMYALNGDGLDDNVATVSGGGGTAAFFFCAAVRTTAIGANQTIWADTGTNTGYRVRVNTTGNLELAAGNGTAFTTAASVTALSANTTYVVTAWHDGVNLNCQINTGAIASAAFGVATAGTASATLGASNGGASGFWTGYIGNVVYRKDSALTATQRGQVQQYVAGRAGITI